MIKPFLFSGIMALQLFVVSAFAQYQPSPENLKNRETFQNDKFGLFIHWGPYSVLGSGEWVLQQRPMKLTEYEKLATFFNPIKYDAKAWVQIAKSAGMKYITITSRHHDGFAMYDSKVSTWDIVDRTVFKRDVLKELSEECKKEGIKLCFYYSHLDWAHTDFYPRGNSGKMTGRPESGDWNKYLRYMNDQLTELLTNYGEIGAIWFDGWWDKKDADWKLKEQYELIHKLQPGCLIGNNHHQPVKDGEDFQMFEQDLPGGNKTGFSGESKIGALPLEMCETMYGAWNSRDQTSWGYKVDSKSFKNTKDLVSMLVKAAGHNSNFLLNVGPTPMGEIQSEFIDTLKKVGMWTSKYGETIYGTRGGPIAPHAWGVSTAKGNTIYVHVMDQIDAQLWLPMADKKVKKLSNFQDKMPVEFTKMKDGILVTLPAQKAGEHHRILEIGI
jgi:alpha-L-fucosidase